MEKENFWQNLKKPIIAVAPMDGVTDNAFRSILKQAGADLVYSEFVSVDGIFHAPQRMEPTMAFTEEQRPYITQIFGKKPDMFKHAAGVVAELGASGVDINFGCPSKKVVAHGSGVKLMTNLDLVYDIVKSTIEGAKGIPVSIKIRAGINIKPEDQEKRDAGEVEKITAIQMIDHIKDLDFKAIMIHGRTYEQGFIGDLDLEQIKGIKEIVGDKIVLVNGGITSPEIAKDILEKTGVDGIGIGRGVFGKPWLCQQIKDYLATGEYTEPSWEEKKKLIIEHTKLMFQTKGNHGMMEIRKHLAWYIKGIHNASHLRAELVRVETIEEVKKILDSI
jgi:tRNA-dihydrouridine synthase B